jgi:hypothetical protein
MIKSNNLSISTLITCPTIAPVLGGVAEYGENAGGNGDFTFNFEDPLGRKKVRIIDISFMVYANNDTVGSYRRMSGGALLELYQESSTVPIPSGHAGYYTANTAPTGVVITDEDKQRLSIPIGIHNINFECRSALKLKMRLLHDYILDFWPGGGYNAHFGVYVSFTFKYI